jgi:hypothetical protein
MEKLTDAEKIQYNSCANMVGRSLHQYEQIIESFKKETSSFDFLFALERTRIAASLGGKQLMRAIRDIKNEMHIQSQNKNRISDPWRDPGVWDAGGIGIFDPPPPRAAQPAMADALFPAINNYVMFDGNLPIDEAINEDEDDEE